MNEIVPHRAPLAPGDMPWSIMAGNISKHIYNALVPLVEQILQRIDQFGNGNAPPREPVKKQELTTLPEGHAEFLVDLIRRELAPHDCRENPTKLVGAEIGVWQGNTSYKLLDAFGDLFLYMFDTWGSKPASDDWKFTGDPLAYQPPEVWQKVKELAEHVQIAFQGRCSIQERPSTDIPVMIEDGMLDFAFIDADHSLAAVRADIAAWWPKIKKGGILSGHDYLTEDESLQFHCCFGVIEAVDEFVAREGLTLKVDPKSSVWWVRKP